MHRNDFNRFGKVKFLNSPSKRLLRQGEASQLNHRLFSTIEIVLRRGEVVLQQLKDSMI